MKDRQKLPDITCPQCGENFAPRHHRTVFCCPVHRQVFYKIDADRGQVLLPFAMISRKGKSGFNDDRRYALQQYNALVDRFNAEDKAAGRRPDLIVSAKRRAGWAACDLGN